ncbi:unnamed protein product, partial [Rotaria sordida]
MITGIILAQTLVGTKVTIVALDFAFSIILYIALHVGRLLSVIILYPFINWSGVRLSWKEYTILTWSGLRGKKLVEEMDSQRRSNIYRQLTITPDSPSSPSSYFSPKTTITDVELKEILTIYENNYVPINIVPSQQNTSHQDVVLPMIENLSHDSTQNENFRNELTIRFLTALSVDYEKQWYLGMIRRRTLYILIKSVEKAKHQHSLKLHWKLIVEHFRFSKWLLNLMRFDYINWINEQFHKLLFDNIFRTIELTLAFHSARTRVDNIRIQFPELANIDERIWHEILQETHLYHLTAIYMLLDLQQSYEVCWRIHMTKRCAQMLLKYESKAITEIYETGILGETEYSYILGLIENKLFDLEFYRVRMPKGETKVIKNAFDLLLLFRSLPNNEKAHWQAIMKAKHRWFQP